MSNHKDIVDAWHHSSSFVIGSKYSLELNRIVYTFKGLVYYVHLFSDIDPEELDELKVGTNYPLALSRDILK